ncbi:hypothetical protein RCL1_000221 [Eukaryota sp. TZLM3-RCL]
MRSPHPNKALKQAFSALESLDTFLDQFQPDSSPPSVSNSPPPPSDATPFHSETEDSISDHASTNSRPSPPSPPADFVLTPSGYSPFSFIPDTHVFPAELSLDNSLADLLPPPPSTPSSPLIFTSPPFSPISSHHRSLSRSYSVSSNSGSSFFLVSDDFLVDYLTGPKPPETRDLCVFMYSLPIIMSVERFFELVLLRIKKLIGLSIFDPDDVDDEDSSRVATDFVLHDSSKLLVFRAFNLILKFSDNFYDPCFTPINHSVMESLVEMISIASNLKLNVIYDSLQTAFFKFSSEISVQNFCKKPFNSVFYTNSRFTCVDSYFSELSNLILKANNKCKFLELVKISAAVFTTIDLQLLKNLPSKFLISLAYRKSLCQSYPECSSFSTLVNRFDNLAQWAISIILFQSNSKNRIGIFGFLIHLLFELAEIRNFHSLFALLAALKSAPVRRLSSCWNTLDKNLIRKFTEVTQLMDVTRNWRNLRKIVDDVIGSKSITTPIIPWIGIFMNDLVFLLSKSNGTSKDKFVINFSKYTKCFSLVDRFEYLISRWNSFEFRADDVMYNYLVNLPCLYNEESAFIKSLEIEKRR